MSETMAYVATAASTQYYSRYNKQNNYCVYCYKDITARGGSRVLEGVDSGKYSFSNTSYW